jgi:hypothetical protein
MSLASSVYCTVTSVDAKNPGVWAVQRIRAERGVGECKQPKLRAVTTRIYSFIRLFFVSATSLKIRPAIANFR